MSVAQLDRLIADLQVQAGNVTDESDIDVSGLLASIQSSMGATGVAYPATGYELKDALLRPKLSGNMLSGYCAVWRDEKGQEIIDDYDDHVCQHSWKSSIAQLKAMAHAQGHGYILPLLWNHVSPKDHGLIGSVVELDEDEKGVAFSAKLADVPRASEAYQLCKANLCGASYRYRPVDFEYLPHPKKPNKSYRRLKALSVSEISVIPAHNAAANPYTNVFAKSGLKSSPELQGYLENLRKRNVALDVTQKQMQIFLYELERYFNKNFS